MKYIYLIFSNATTLTGKLVCTVTKYDYAHVAISLDDKFNKMFSFGRKYKISPLIGCFKIENIRNGLYKKDGAKVKIFRINVSDDSYLSLEKSIMLLSPKKNGYNMLGAALIPLGIKIKRKNKYFCSEFISSILESSGVLKFGKHTSLITPKDIMEKLKTTSECIFNGKICNFVAKL